MQKSTPLCDIIIDMLFTVEIASNWSRTN